MILPILIPFSIHILSVPELFTKLCVAFFRSCVISMFISVLAVSANLVDYLINGYDNEMLAVYLMLSFFGGLNLFAILGISGAVWRNKALVIGSAGVWLLLCMFWLAMCCVQFASWFSIPDVCINRRCPDAFWLSDWYWRAFQLQENSTTNEPLSDETAEPKFHKNSLYLTGSILVFVSFLFYMAMLGSIVRSVFETLILMGNGFEMTTGIPSAFMLFLPLRQVNEVPTAEAQSSANLPASTTLKPQPSTPIKLQERDREQVLQKIDAD